MPQYLTFIGVFFKKNAMRDFSPSLKTLAFSKRLGKSFEAFLDPTEAL